MILTFDGAGFRNITIATNHFTFYGNFFNPAFPKATSFKFL